MKDCLKTSKQYWLLKNWQFRQNPSIDEEFEKELVDIAEKTEEIKLAIRVVEKIDVKNGSNFTININFKWKAFFITEEPCVTKREV